MSLLTPSFVSALGWALVHFLWQGLVVGMVAALALMLLRNARPQLRYAVACLALVLCVALPVTGVVRGLHADAADAARPAPAVMHAAQVLPTFAVPRESWRPMLQARLPLVVVLWSLGAGLLALRMALGLAWVDRIRRTHAGTIDPEWQARLDRLATAFGLPRHVSLRVASDLDSPVAAGWWRPMLLVPAALIARMPTDLLEALLAHELAHIKRHDYLVNLIQSAIEALLFYHPVVWWLSKQARIERERIADDLAARVLGEPRRLAIALQELDLFHSSTDRLSTSQLSTSHLAPAARGGNLMSRIQHLIQPGQHALSWKIALPIVGLSAICLTVFAQGGAPEPAKPTADTADSSHVTLFTKKGPEEAYALIRDGHEGMTVSGDMADIRDAEKTRRSLQGDFLWFRRDGKAYVVQDPALIARATEAWKPTDALGAQMDALGDKMDIHGKVMDDLGDKMGALSSRGEPAEAEMEKTSEQMEALSQQQEAIGEKMEVLGRQMARAQTDGEQEALSRQMEALQVQMEPLQAQMETLSRSMSEHGNRLEAAHQPMEALGRQMEEASKPMEVLGQQMEVLGKQQEKLSREADRVVRSLMDEALKTGKAVPAPRLQ